MGFLFSAVRIRIQIHIRMLVPNLLDDCSLFRILDSQAETGGAVECGELLEPAALVPLPLRFTMCPRTHCPPPPDSVLSLFGARRGDNSI